MQHPSCPRHGSCWRTESHREECRQLLVGSAFKIAARRGGRLPAGEVCKGRRLGHRQEQETDKGGGFESNHFQLTRRYWASENYPPYWEFAKNSVSSRGNFKALGPDCYCIAIAWSKYVIIQRSFCFYKYLAQTCAYICVFTAMG